jgi:hypothetical protein
MAVSHQLQVSPCSPTAPSGTCCTPPVQLAAAQTAPYSSGSDLSEHYATRRCYRSRANHTQGNIKASKPAAHGFAAVARQCQSLPHLAGAGWLTAGADDGLRHHLDQLLSSLVGPLLAGIHPSTLENIPGSQLPDLLSSWPSLHALCFSTAQVIHAIQQMCTWCHG